MNQSTFRLLASARARYYTKGSPVQFTCVELLRMEETGNMVVTLTFRNFYTHPLTQFTAHFRCKDAQGQVLGEDDFSYMNLRVPVGGTFGQDTAVFISDEPVGSVEVNLVSAAYDGSAQAHSLLRCQPVTLPALRPLPEMAMDDVDHALQMECAHYYPASAQDGWQCTCGAFNYNAGRFATVCSECGAEKTAVFSAVRAAAGAPRGQQDGGAFLPVKDANTNLQRVTTHADRRAIHVAKDLPSYHSGIPLALHAQDGAAVLKPHTVDFLLRWLPLITVGGCSLYVLGAWLVHLLIR